MWRSATSGILGLDGGESMSLIDGAIGTLRVSDCCLMCDVHGVILTSHTFRLGATMS